MNHVEVFQDRIQVLGIMLFWILLGLLFVGGVFFNIYELEDGKPKRTVVARYVVIFTVAYLCVRYIRF